MPASQSRAICRIVREIRAVLPGSILSARPMKCGSSATPVPARSAVDGQDRRIFGQDRRTSRVEAKRPVF